MKCPGQAGGAPCDSSTYDYELPSQNVCMDISACCVGEGSAYQWRPLFLSLNAYHIVATTHTHTYTHWLLSSNVHLSILVIGVVAVATISVGPLYLQVLYKKIHALARQILYFHTEL